MKNFFNKIKNSFLNILDASVKFQGVLEEKDVVYNQIHLEKAVWGMEDNKPDYCFVWCLMQHYHLHENKPWNKIAEALKTCPEAYFSVKDGWLKSISGVTRHISKAFGLDYYLQRALVCDLKEDTTEEEAAMAINKFIKFKFEDSLSFKVIPGDDYFFLMKRYWDGLHKQIMHFTYVNRYGVEYHPYPKVDLYPNWRPYGYRLYKMAKF